MRNNKDFPKMVDSMFEDGSMKTVTYNFSGGALPDPEKGHGPRQHAEAPVTWAGWDEHWLDDQILVLPDGAAPWIWLGFVAGMVAGAAIALLAQ